MREPVQLAKGDPVVLFERVLAKGDVIWLDVHVFCAFGSVEAAQPQALDGYLVAWRETTGDVQVTEIGGVSAGRIPGFEVFATGTATSVRITAEARTAGTLKIFQNETEIKGIGTL